MRIPVGWRVTDEEEGSLLRAKKDPSYSPVIGADVLQKKKKIVRERERGRDSSWKWQWPALNDAAIDGY